MENLEILVLTFAVVVSFISFGIATYIQFRNMSKNEYKGGGQSHGESSVVNFLGEMIDDDSIKKK
jgi:hypothetical protein